VYGRPSKGESVTIGVSANVDWPSGSAVTKRPLLLNRQLAPANHHSARGHAARLIRKIFAIDLAATIQFDHLVVEQHDTAATTVEVQSSAYEIVVASTLRDNSLSKISAASPYQVVRSTVSATARPNRRSIQQ
jgi:hypothetical protein